MGFVDDYFDFIISVFAFIFIFVCVAVSATITCSITKHNVCETFCKRDNHSSGKWNNEKENCVCADDSELGK